MAAKYKVLAADNVSLGGAAAELRYLVVRGISHYCDREKGRRPQRWDYFAAAAAAAYLRCILEASKTLAQ